MILRRLTVLVGLTIAIISISMADDGWVIREDGVGPVKVGMTLSQLNTVLHEKFSMPHSKDEQSCFYVGPTKHAQIAFMIQAGRLVRIDVDEAGVSTAEGIQVGDSESRALQVYGPRLRVKPHAYTGPQGHYLTIRSSNGRYGIRFETGEGKITMFYAGRFDAIQYIEGCQ
jgi:hypothetical protein